MALTKIQAGSFEAGAISTADLSANTTAAFAVTLTPKVTTVNVANSSYTVLDDTAVNVGGGYIVVTGSDFQSGAVVLVDTTQATSTTFVNSTTLRAQIPAKSAATYNIYVVNPDGGVGIKLNGVNYSATPTWVTSSPLANVQNAVSFSGTFDATGATAYSVASGSSLPDGMTLVGANGYYYGTITLENDTTYSFTINATDAENQDSPATFNLTAIAQVLDTYFNSTVLLLRGDGTNGSQNQTFVDSSNNNFTITRAGNATQGTFSPFSPTGWAAYFDGTGDELNNIGTVSSFNFIHQANGKFTIEFWAFPLGSGTLFDNTSATSNETGIFASMGANNTVRCFITKSSGLNWIVDGWSTTALELNSWNHFVITYDHSLASNNMKFYVNGNPAGTLTKTANVPSTGNASNAFRIGGAGSGGYSGYISNFRIVNDVVYSSSFTEPVSPLTAIANTHLLACQSNRFIDNSNNSYSISTSGDVKIAAFSPFAPATAWSAASYGGSAYFDGTDDYLTLTHNDSIAFGTQDFTVEWWLNSTDTGIGIIQGDANAGWGATILSGTFYWQSVVGVTNLLSTSVSSYLKNAWHHWAVVRSSGTLTLYINGVSIASTSDSTNYSDTSGTMYIGSYPASGAALNGNISGLRILKGTALYTSAFTPPTAPPTAIANTSLLLNFTNAGIYDATAKNVLETIGNAQISTSVKKYGTGSMAFDGTGDYLTIRHSSELMFGTGDFTIEFWIYITGVQTSGNSWIAAIAKRGSASTDGTWAIDFANGTADLRYRLLNVTGGTVTVSIGTVPTSQWVHVAVSKQSGTTRTYLNGVAGGTTTNAISVNGSTEPINIGWDNFGGGLNGYIDDLRITKGIARYTSNFTPPTTEHPIQ